MCVDFESEVAFVLWACEPPADVVFYLAEICRHTIVNIVANIDDVLSDHFGYISVVDFADCDCEFVVHFGSSFTSSWSINYLMSLNS